MILDLEEGHPWVVHAFPVEEFQMAVYPVTLAQWRVFLAAEDGYDSSIRKQYNAEPARQRGRDNQPATDLAWVEALAYCEWLTKRLRLSKLLGDGYEVRLPTEWEWQQAATGGDAQNQYPWRRDWLENRANTVESDQGWMLAVGLYPTGASAQGIEDLAGNAWEWCLNKFEEPSDIGLEGNDRRVLRGGSWRSHPVNTRAACRDYNHPADRSHYIGFRLVCCVSPPS